MSSDSNRLKCKLILIFSVVLFAIFIIAFISWAQSEALEAKKAIQTFNEIQELAEIPISDLEFDEESEVDEEPEANEELEVDEDKTSIVSESQDNDEEDEKIDDDSKATKEEPEEVSNQQSSQDSNNSLKANVVYIDSSQFKQDGVWYDSRYRYTYYSSQVLYHYRTSEWTAGQDGVYRDSDGYVIVSSSDLSQGTVITDTPFGDCKVYDSGCASGTLDVYVNW